MVKKSVTLLEETVFQHVTIHKLMIYIYGQIKMSRDPLLAVIRTNILELKNMARHDPLVIIASSKTILKTLLNFTRLKFIRKETVIFLRRVMQDVYSRMLKLWDIYQSHRAYEKCKTGKNSISPGKKSSKERNGNKSLHPTKNAINKQKESSESIANTKDSVSTPESTTNQKLKTFVEPSYSEADESLTDTSPSTKDSAGASQQSKSPKKRKMKKWSLGVIRSKKRKRTNSPQKKLPVAVPEHNAAVPEHKMAVPEHKVAVPEHKMAVPEHKVAVPEHNVAVPEHKKELKNINTGHEKLSREVKSELSFKQLQKKFHPLNIHCYENIFDKSSVVQDKGWVERLRVQREYYLNEMYRVAQRLKLRNPQQFDFVDNMADKLGVTVSTYGHKLEELMVLDHAELIQASGNTAATSPSETDWAEIESNNCTTVSIFKATPSKKRFIYECLADGCDLKTTNLLDLQNHASNFHKSFTWDWTCSTCGMVQLLTLKSANQLDMVMYHLWSYHSVKNLKRNPVELELTSLELQTRNKVKIDYPLCNLIPSASVKNINYCSQLYKCFSCNFSSGLMSDAAVHYTLELIKCQVLICLYCEECFVRAEDLCVHLNDYHSSSKYLCSECHYRSVSYHNTLNHYLSEHDDRNGNKDAVIYINVEPQGVNQLLPIPFPSKLLKTYTCSHADQEDYRTLIGAKYVSHLAICQLRSGIKLKKYDCPECGIKIIAAHNMRHHYETHQVSKYICFYCGNGLSKLHAIKAHLHKTHMFWPPRFVIREDFNNCPGEISAEHFYLIKYETPFEDLIEVSLDASVDEDDTPNIKLQFVTGEIASLDTSRDQMKQIKTRLHRSTDSRSGVIEVISDTDDDADMASCRFLPGFGKAEQADSLNSNTPCSKLSKAEVRNVTSNLDNISSNSSVSIAPNPSNLRSTSKDSLNSSSLTTQSSSTPEESRTPEIRVIAAAKMDNFRKSSDSCDLLKMDNLQSNEPNSSESSISNLGGSQKTLNVLTGNVNKTKRKMIQIRRLSKEVTPIQDSNSCPYCNFTDDNKVLLAQHISRLHVDVLNINPTIQNGRNFECSKCQSSFQAFASLHKHIDTMHGTDPSGSFKIYIQGYLLVRKNIKVCFLCSTLIVSLEELYKHPDICPFAHTTGTPLSSSIVYAIARDIQIGYTYQKKEIKVNKAIVELLQPHHPTSRAQDGAPKRAVARKSTGPRPPPPAPGSSHVNTKKPVAKKSTGPHVLSASDQDPDSSE